MIASSDYTLQEIPDRDIMREAEYRLVLRGTPLPHIVTGDEIDFQFSCGEFTLLSTSWDWFYGVEYWIWLLRKDGRPIDELVMPDRFRGVTDVRIVSPCEVAFGRTDDRWSVAVSEEGFWSWRPSVVWRRPMGFWLSKRRLSLRRTTGAPRSSKAS